MFLIYVPRAGYNQWVVRIPVSDRGLEVRVELQSLLCVLNERLCGSTLYN